MYELLVTVYGKVMKQCYDRCVLLCPYVETAINPVEFFPESIKNNDHVHFIHGIEYILTFSFISASFYVIAHSMKLHI